MRAADLRASGDAQRCQAAGFPENSEKISDGFFVGGSVCFFASGGLPKKTARYCKLLILGKFLASN